MKQLFSLLLIYVMVVSCNTQEKIGNENTQTDEVIKENFDWLLGNWIPTNEKENKQTFEQWKKQSDTMYIGVGYTMQNADTTWREDVVLHHTNKGWSFDVTGKGETAPTKFKLIQLAKGTFTCENQSNEFPKRIVYQTKGDTLHAKISGGDLVIPFDFVKEKQQ